MDETHYSLSWPLLPRFLSPSTPAPHSHRITATVCPCQFFRSPLCLSYLLSPAFLPHDFLHHYLSMLSDLRPFLLTHVSSLPPLPSLPPLAHIVLACRAELQICFLFFIWRLWRMMRSISGGSHLTLPFIPCARTHTHTHLLNLSGKSDWHSTYTSFICIFEQHMFIYIHTQTALLHVCLAIWETGRWRANTLGLVFYCSLPPPSGFSPSTWGQSPIPAADVIPDSIWDRQEMSPSLLQQKIKKKLKQRDIGLTRRLPKNPILGGE